jgi:hypothetical protein
MRNDPLKLNGKKRSPKWAAFRRQFLQGKVCAVCGGTKKLELHHIRPFHLHPELELDEGNVIPLCENNKDGVNCHLLFGHLGSFKSFNLTVISDAESWNKKIKDRPQTEEAA